MQKIFLPAFCSHPVALLFFLLQFLVAPPPEVLSQEPHDITAPEVKHMLDNHLATVINVLSAIEFEAQHITGSINIPLTRLKTSGTLPKDKDTTLIFYCMGKL